MSSRQGSFAGVRKSQVLYTRKTCFLYHALLETILWKMGKERKDAMGGYGAYIVKYILKEFQLECPDPVATL